MSDEQTGKSSDISFPICHPEENKGSIGANRGWLNGVKKKIKGSV